MVCWLKNSCGYGSKKGTQKNLLAERKKIPKPVVSAWGFLDPKPCLWKPRVTHFAHGTRLKSPDGLQEHHSEASGDQVLHTSEVSNQRSATKHLDVRTRL